MYSQSRLAGRASEENSSGKISNLSSPVTIRETGFKGRGVFSARELQKGEVVVVGKPVSKLPERTWQSLQVGMNTHIRIDIPFEFVNHSCDPNCGIKTNRFNGYNLVAMRDIEAGEEITFDYCMTEWIIMGFLQFWNNKQRSVCKYLYLWAYRERLSAWLRT